MKKSFIALFLCMTCITALAGCQSSPSSQTSQAEASAQAETAAGTGTEKAAPEEAAEAESSDSSMAAAAPAQETAPEWTDMTVSFDDLSVKIPMAYGDLSDSWTMETGEEEGPADLQPGERREGIRLVHEDMDDVYVYVTLVNENEEPAPPESCSVYGFSAEVTWVEEEDPMPSLSMPGDVTWGSGREDLEAAFGQPAAEHRAEEQEYTSYTYAYNYTEMLLTFTVFDEKGLTAVSVSKE